MRISFLVLTLAIQCIPCYAIAIPNNVDLQDDLVRRGSPDLARPLPFEDKSPTENTVAEGIAKNENGSSDMTPAGLAEPAPPKPGGPASPNNGLTTPKGQMITFRGRCKGKRSTYRERGLLRIPTGKRGNGDPKYKHTAEEWDEIYADISKRMKTDPRAKGKSIDFIVLGGASAIAHGSRGPDGKTPDTDVVPAQRKADPELKAAFKDALEYVANLPKWKGTLNSESINEQVSIFFEDSEKFEALKEDSDETMFPKVDGAGGPLHLKHGSPGIQFMQKLHIMWEAVRYGPTDKYRQEDMDDARTNLKLARDKLGWAIGQSEIDEWAKAASISDLYVEMILKDFLPLVEPDLRSFDDSIKKTYAC